MLPRPPPPMRASRAITSPSTVPPFATSTWRPARTVPTTVPSTFTTPSAVMSPTTRIPVPMIDRPASASPWPWPFSVKSAMSVALLHQRERVQRFAVPPDLKMEMRRRRAPGIAGQRDDFSGRHDLALNHEQPRGVAIHALIPFGMPQEYEQPVIRIGPDRGDRTAAGCAHRRAQLRGDVDARMRLGRITRADLAASDEAATLQWPVPGHRSAILIMDAVGGGDGIHRYRAHEIAGGPCPALVRRGARAQQ